MPIRVVVQGQAQPGKRAELRTLLGSKASTHGPGAAGFLGSTVYETLDSDDGLVEIAQWQAQRDATLGHRVAARGMTCLDDSPEVSLGLIRQLRLLSLEGGLQAGEAHR